MSFGNANDSKNGTGAWTGITQQPGDGPGPTPQQANAANGSPFLDPNYYPDAANDDAAKRAVMVGNKSAQLMGRAAPQLVAGDTSGLTQARNNQEQSLGLMRNAAMGQVPSIAQAQTYGAMGSNIAAMNAASQGGPAAGAMNQGAGIMNNTAGQGAMARSGEQAWYMSQYGQATGGLQKNDIGQYGSDTEQYLRGLGLGTQQGILNANTVFGLQGQEMQNEIGHAAAAQQAQAQNQQQKNQDVQQGLTTAGTVVGAAAAAMSDRRVKTGIRRGIMGNK